MGYTRPSTFQPGTFLRTCDLCGIRYRNTELRKGEDGFWRCVRYCIEIPALTRDKISAESQRRKEAPPPPHGIPFTRASTYAQEQLVFDLVCELATSSFSGGLASNASGFDSVQVASGNPALTLSASTVTGTTLGNFAEMARYLYNLVVEGKRPKAWTSLAATKLSAIATLLISKQNGFGQNPSLTLAGSLLYGSIGAPVYCNDNAQAGLACLYAYRISGNPAFLASAQAFCHCLRNMQSIGAFLASNFTSSDSAGTVRLYTGGIVNQALLGSSGQSDQGFYPSSMVALEFFRELLSTSGDGPYGCTATASGAFISSPQINLTKMIADFRAFWSVGAFDNVVGKTFTGLSATTPAEFFNAYPSTHTGFSGRQGTGSGSWEYQDAASSTGTLVTGSNFAQALRSLFAYEGYTTQVSSVWTWLMSFQANPSFVLPAGTLASDYACVTSTSAANPPTPPIGSGNVIAPFYDPTLALTTLLLVRDSTKSYAATKQNGSSLYDWTTAGMMAAIQTIQNNGAFKKAKDKLVAGYTRLPVTYSDSPAVVQDSPMLRGTSGLAFQLNQNDQGSQKLWNGGLAAKVANVFRFQPQSFTGTNPPQQQPGVGT